MVQLELLDSKDLLDTLEVAELKAKQDSVESKVCKYFIGLLIKSNQM